MAACVLPDLRRGLTGFVNAADNGLNQVVYPLLLAIVQGAKAKLRLAVWALAEAHGQSGRTDYSR